jgi:fructose-1,6-bisphosphatase/inositol monophosphatase family enzyme
MNSLTGYEEDLGKRFRMGWGAKLNSVTLAHHITRAKGASGENKADVYMPVFNNLHNASKGTYAYNCGIYSAIQVVRGVVGGYINSHMPPHDACHIYALVAAAARSPDCVTTLSGGPVRWDSSDRIGLVAASPAVRKQIVQEISRAGVREVAEHGAMSRKSKRNRNPSDQPASPPLATA